jgi:proteasome lid subunit RPN8/RPN11
MELNEALKLDEEVNKEEVVEQEVKHDIALIVDRHAQQDEFNPVINNIEVMNAHFLNEFPKEACGVVVNGEFIACENVHETPEDDFRIRKGDYFKHLEAGVDAIMHSHTITGPTHKFDNRTPSMADMQGQKNTAVPWGIVATEGENVTCPLWFGLPKPAALEGRLYIPNVYDCLNLVCDYMKLEFDIDLPIFPRPIEWQTMNKNMITDGIDVSGFRRLSRSTPLDELQHGDFILFKIQASYVNHCGVITEDGMFYHQLAGRYSKKDHIGRWENQIAMYLRHEDLE